jgi:hypothetical protein
MNPVVDRLLTGVSLLAAISFQHALKQGEPLIVEHLTDDLLAPAYILANVARDFNTPLVDDYALLRKRTDEELDAPPALVADLLAGAGFSDTPRTYPEAAHANCSADEVRIEYLPVGATFYFDCGGGKTRRGTLISKTASRAVVEWQGKAESRTFHDNRNDKDVTITSAGNYRQGCALDCGVVPIHRVIAPEDHDWAVNAYKEMVGTFDEPKKGKRK